MTFVPGKTAVLTIYENDQEREKVTLSNLEKKEHMHAMMAGKGFTKKSEEAIELAKRKIEDNVAEKLKEGVAKEIHNKKLRESNRKKEISGWGPLRTEGIKRREQDTPVDEVLSSGGVTGKGKKEVSSENFNGDDWNYYLLPSNRWTLFLVAPFLLVFAWYTMCFGRQSCRRLGRTFRITADRSS